MSEWYRYMGKAARNAVMQTLYRRGLVVKENTCKYCRHRAQFNPHKCSLVRYLDHETSEMVENPNFDFPTRASDLACGGFEPNVVQFDREADAAEKFEAWRQEGVTPEMVLQTQEIFDMCVDLLIQRQERAGSESVRKKRHWEYLLFVNITALIRTGFSEEEATTELLKEIVDSKRRQAFKKQIQRSRSEIYRYLRQNLPIELISELLEQFHGHKGGR